MGNRHLNPMPNNNMLNINEGNEQNLIPVEEQNQIIQERATTKKILAIRLPVYLRKPTLLLEQDSIFQDKYYIKFHYDALVNLDCYINFNVSLRANLHLHHSDTKIHKLAYTPSLNLASKGITINNLPSGENVEFSNNDAFIDLNNFLINKGDASYDLCIEFVPIYPKGSPELENNNEIVFVSLCNFERHKQSNSYEIKCPLQRLRTHDMWIDFHDIFDSSLDGGLCLICCSIVRNTIFLPCKHAACCDKCGSEIKLRFKPCPICKTPIDDLLIVDSDEKKFEGDADIIDVDENVMDDEKLIGDITLSNDASQNDINQNNHNNETNIFHVNENNNNNEGKDEKINEQKNITVNNDNINSDENLNLLAQNNDFIS
jgi:hypothetical protein